MTAVGASAADAADILNSARTAFSFADGTRYEDHRTEDKVAEYGIAGLVATLVGVKVAAKLGFLAIFAAFAKKAVILVFLALAAVGGWIKRIFSRRPSVAPPSARRNEASYSGPDSEAG